MADSKKHTRTCRMCKNTYKYCNCEEYKHLPPFMLAFCSENCNDIDIILSNWGAKIIDSETAYELIKAKDTSRAEFWPESFRNAYEQILKDTGHFAKEEPEPEPEPDPEPETKPLTVSEELKAGAKRTTNTGKVRQNKKVAPIVGE